MGTGIALVCAMALLIIVAYGVTAYQGHADGTTEVAALLVLTAGILAGTGKIALASAINAITALLLVEKSRIHGLVFRIQSEELSAAFRFAVLALVILPVLPEGPYGPPPGIRPRELWALVLIFSGLSFLGFLARRIVGPGRGYQVAGLLGGLISSTAVTLTFSNESRSHSTVGRALAFGVIGASTVLFFRAPILAFILNPALGIALIPYVVFPGIVGLGVILFTLRKKEKEESDAPAPKNPLRLFSAIQMVLVFQIVLYVVSWVSNRFGSEGILWTSALLGLTDVDALIFSMAKIADPSRLNVAAEGMAIGMIANTLFKAGIAVVIGRDLFRKISVAGLLILAAATAVGLFFF